MSKILLILVIFLTCYICSIQLCYSGSVSGIARDWTGAQVVGKNFYYTCYALAGTGNNIHPDYNAPVGTDASDPVGEWSVTGLTTGTEYFCTSQYYGTHNGKTKMGGAEFKVAQ